MDGWMDGWVRGWGCVDGWMEDGRMGGFGPVSPSPIFAYSRFAYFHFAYSCTFLLVTLDGWMDRWMDGWIGR